MGNFVLNIMGKYGYIGIFFLIAIENLFPPIPSEVILTFGGFLTTYSSLNPIGVIIASTIGSVVGAIILYYLGTFVKVKKEDLGKTNNWFDKYGNKAVLLGRFVPIVRSLISIPAGTNKMNMPKFLVYTTIGSVIWNTCLVYAGVLLGSNWSVVADILGKYSNIVLYILIIIIGVKLLKKFKYKNNI